MQCIQQNARFKNHLLFSRGETNLFEGPRSQWPKVVSFQVRGFIFESGNMRPNQRLVFQPKLYYNSQSATVDCGLIFCSILVGAMTVPQNSCHSPIQNISTCSSTKFKQTWRNVYWFVMIRYVSKLTSRHNPSVQVTFWAFEIDFDMVDVIPRTFWSGDVGMGHFTPVYIHIWENLLPL